MPRFFFDSSRPFSYTSRHIARDTKPAQRKSATSMKVSVRNLGVIKEASFDLKSLTVFIGPNNAGKTWLAYSLAGILSSFGSSQYTQAYTEKRVLHTYEPLDTAIERVLAEGNATIDLRQFAEEYG